MRLAKPDAGRMALDTLFTKSSTEHKCSRRSAGVPKFEFSFAGYAVGRMGRGATMSYHEAQY